MAKEYEKTKAYERGLEGKSARSGFSPKFPDADEEKANQEGKRQRARQRSRQKNKRK